MNEKYKKPEGGKNEILEDKKLEGNNKILESIQITQNEVGKLLAIINANNEQSETISSEIENQLEPILNQILEAVFKQIKDAAETPKETKTNTPETVETEGKKTTTITLNGKKIPNVPDGRRQNKASQRIGENDQ